MSRPPLKILIAGATGVLGRATLPHLAGHDVLGVTRDGAKAGALEAAGARAAECDVYAPGAFARIAAEFAPDVVVNFLTDLARGPGPANARIREVGGPIVSAAARGSGARRLVVESIAFSGAPASMQAVAALEADARASGLEALVLRFGRFWGPGTWSVESAPEAPAVHVGEAGRRAAELILTGAPGDHVIAD
ncbi:MAG TPA: NAD-dependent epimerase/dehydratase family protein [Polyangia bacterium]|nr:NAD-dependent epimerase/dehydratase family protein [Polyangia bacterium]